MAKNYANRTLFLTGGAGYIGTEVVKEFLKLSPKKLVVLDNFSKGRIENIAYLKDKHKNLFIEQADIRDYPVIEKLLLKYRPDSVIHLAAIVDAFSTNRKGKDEECMDVNYLSSVALAKMSKTLGVKNFIFQCTVSLYSRGEDLKENAKKEPLSVYGKSKLLAETKILKMNDKNFNVCSLRPATAVGYNHGFRYETIFNQICIKAIYKLPLRFFESALSGDKSYLATIDNAGAIIFALDNISKMKGQAFNVSSFNVNLSQIAEGVLKEYGKFDYEIVKEKHISQQVYTVNAEKISKLGFKPKAKMRDVIKKEIKGLLAEKNFLAKTKV